MSAPSIERVTIYCSICDEAVTVLVNTCIDPHSQAQVSMLEVATGGVLTDESRAALEHHVKAHPHIPDEGSAIA